MDKRVIGFVCFLIAILVTPSAIVLIYNLEYYANALSSVVIAIVCNFDLFTLARAAKREREVTHSGNH